ncbi:hypothetical protein MMC28_008512 [Mycoblastus sanguinarius]|nr:hypothetical protein [Mycoblastus sanguinarius]
MDFLSILFVSGMCILAAYYISKSQRRWSLVRANGCQPPRKFPHKDPILGLDLFFKAGKLFEENRYLPELVQRYNDNGSTFETESLGSFTVNSIAPKNLETVWSLKFSDWGVEPMDQVGSIREPLLKPSFSKENMTDLLTLERYLKMVINRIPKDGSTVDLQPLFFSLFLDSSTLFLFGESIESLSGDTSVDAERFLKAFDYAMFGSGFRIALGPFKFLYRDPKWLESCKITHKFAEKYVDKALEYRQASQSRAKDSMPKDHTNRQQHILLFAMAEQTDDRTGLRNQILQALMAAQETTAALISNVFFLLARHPITWQRLREEVVSLGDREPDLDLHRNMKYLRNILNETLRLYPVFPQMNRVALNNTTLPVGGGPDGTSPIYIPAGTMFDTSWYVLHRIPSIWGPDADVFNPDRWDTIKPRAWEYVPFGGGQRGCAGRVKALTEASYVIVRMMQEFHHIESRNKREWTGHVQLTAKNANGCKVALTPSQQSF